MVSDLEHVTDYALSHDQFAKGVVQIGLSLGGNVVTRYNRKHRNDVDKKLCGTIETGGPYKTLHPDFMPLLVQIGSLPDVVTELPNPLAQGAYLEAQMVHWDAAFNEKIKQVLSERTPLIPVGPFKYDFSNFSKIADDWHNTDPTLPFIIFNGHREVVNYTPDVIEGFGALPSKKTILISPAHSGHMVFWEPYAYKEFRETVAAYTNKIYSEC
jgi:alpha-beta hydrolase superfamily lysophospholipase